jgi:NAD(P)-dependent dehydrogenase (short-subunit alcohol dehydrogenase family)
VSVVIEQRPSTGLPDVADQLRDAFLRVRDASYITGQVITVCGGRSLAP